ncbi:hypothetical protein CYMTET_28064 [Cymbomonas tetramitiformis]|uniref:Uncharacterized protein n=1 Tax=Cymbomonas tetramitiformis TaxID=36881 RepID=A0AAE0FP59_9CHLO|nr:hypothetical protein CYMTET_28064 [Cymbomonas tetramitiformis]
MALAAALTPNEQGMLNGSLTTLDLSHNGIGPEGAKAIALAITSNTSLDVLCLLGNDLRAEGARVIVEAFENSTTLTTLCGLTGEIKKLFLEPGSVSDAMLLAADLQKDVYTRDTDAIQILCRNVRNAYYSMRPEQAKLLAASLTPNEQGVFNKSLTTLTITPGVDLPIGALRRNEIAELCLTDEAQLDSGLMEPCDAIILGAMLASNRSLKTLDLAGNNIGAHGAKALAAALTPNQQGVFNGSLNTLRLMGNNIGREGAKALAVALTPNAEGVFNGSLKTLDLGCNEIGSQGAKALAAALTPNAEGVFNGSLDTLKLSDNEIGPEGAKALAVALTPNEKGVFNSSLNTLDLNGNQIRDEGAKALAVALTPNKEGLFNGSLNTLNIESNSIGPEGVKALVVALTPNEEGVFNGSLNRLILGGNRKDGPAWNQIGPKGAKALAVALTPNEKGVFNGSLNSITITNGVELPIGALRENEITELKLSAEGPGLEYAIILGPVLMFNRSLTTLNLAGSQICGVSRSMFGGDKYDASGIKALANALAFNKSLTTLNLGGNSIRPEGAKALAVALTPNAEGVFNGSLNTLILGDNNIGDEGAKALAVALTPNKEGVFNGSLTAINIAGNDIGPEGAKALVAALTLNEAGVLKKSLRTLDLGEVEWDVELISGLQTDVDVRVMAAAPSEPTALFGAPSEPTALCGCGAGECVLGGALAQMQVVRWHRYGGGDWRECGDGMKGVEPARVRRWRGCCAGVGALVRVRVLGWFVCDAGVGTELAWVGWHGCGRGCGGGRCGTNTSALARVRRYVWVRLVGLAQARARAQVSREKELCAVCLQTCIDSQSRDLLMAQIASRRRAADLFQDQTLPYYNSLATLVNRFPHLKREVQLDLVKRIESHWTAELGLAIRLRCNLPERPYQYLINALSTKYNEDKDEYEPIYLDKGVTMPSLGKYASKNKTIRLMNKHFSTSLPEALNIASIDGVTVSFKQALQEYVMAHLPQSDVLVAQLAGDGAWAFRGVYQRTVAFKVIVTQAEGCPLVPHCGADCSEGAVHPVHGTGAWG